MSSTNRGAKRQPRDFYATPRSAVDVLLDRIGNQFWNVSQHCDTRTWLEPCVGDGVIVRAVNKHPAFQNIVWDTIDIEGPAFTPDQEKATFRRMDFMSCETEQDYGYEVIITNPPFSLAQEFIEHSLELWDTRKPTVIMLLRLGILESKKRSKWWQGKEPDAIYVLSKRPDFTGDGGDSCAYGWFFWNWHEKGIFVLEPNACEGVG
ncbi:MAG: hypothetical protein K2X93_23030 [Candidatus Obscuribacterales bacterium]|nr:hypothetical protein [Candidatus Obscuribacterales bacterium]